MGLKKTITGEKENAEAGAWENQQPQRCEEEGAWENIIQYTIVKEKDSLTSKTIKKTKRHQQQQKENPPPATTDHHQNRRKKKRHRIKGRRSTYRRKGTGEKEEEEAHMKEKKWRGRGNGRRKWIVTHTNESLRPFIRKGEIWARNLRSCDLRTSLGLKTLTQFSFSFSFRTQGLAQE